MNPDQNGNAVRQKRENSLVEREKRKRQENAGGHQGLI